MSEWISVDDRMPEMPADDKGYLCRCVYGPWSIPSYYVLKYDCLDNPPHFQLEKNPKVLKVTHWKKFDEPSIKWGEAD